jgi:hypothetical protein
MKVPGKLIKDRTKLHAERARALEESAGTSRG